MSPTVTRQVLTPTAGWTAIPDANAYDGTAYSATTIAGTARRIATPRGTTAALLLATARADCGTCTYTVGGGPPVSWNQSNRQTPPVETRYNWYRTASAPIAITDPANPPPIAVTAAPRGLTTLDTAEFWQRAAVVPKTITWFGHSIIYGYLNQPPYTIPVHPRFSTLVSGWLGMTEINQAVPGEDLTNGNTVPTPYYANTYAPMPGWLRAERGAAFGGTAWGGGAFPYPAHGQPTAQWWATAPQIAVVMHGLNDIGLTSLYDSGSHGYTNAGSGYAIARFTQRLRELVWRMNCASPETRIFLCGICYARTVVDMNTGEPLPLLIDYNNAIASVARDATTQNTFSIDTWTPTANDGRFALFQPGTDLNPDLVHPNGAGHELLARVIYHAIVEAHRPDGSV